MKVLLECDKEKQIISISGRCKPPLASAYRNIVRSGVSDFGLIYDELMALGTGMNEISITKKKSEQSPAS